jgi:hypothetical protein
VATISCFGYWRIWCGIQLTLSNPSDQAITYTFVLNKWYGWKCGLHDYKRWCTVLQLLERYRYQQLRIQLMKWTKTLALPGTASATGTIIDNNNAPTVATITPASATEGRSVFTLHWATLLIKILRILLYWLMVRLEVDYTTTNVELFLRVQLLELYRYQQR